MNPAFWWKMRTCSASTCTPPCPTSFWKKYPNPTFLFHGLGTIAALPFIAQTPVSWFRKLGIACAPGTMIFRLMGAVEQPGFVEVPLSATLGEVINGVGGGFRHGRTPKAILVGGTLGGIFPANFLQISLNHETLRELGGSLALGTIQVLDEKDCIISLVRRQIDFLLDQPGAQCPTCHQSLIRIRDLLAEIAGGEATGDTLEELKTVCERLKLKGSCHLGRQAVNPILTSLQYFPDEYRMHTDNKTLSGPGLPQTPAGPLPYGLPGGHRHPQLHGPGGSGALSGGPGGDSPGQPLPLGLRPHLPAPLRAGLCPGPSG